jgi:hypothetical protein
VDAHCREIGQEAQDMYDLLEAQQSAVAGKEKDYLARVKSLQGILLATREMVLVDLVLAPQ